MRFPRKHEWHEAGNDLYKTGSIIHESHPLHLWLIDRCFLAVETLLSHGPVGRLLTPVWRRLTPEYGDPICFAYLYRWGSWYDSPRHRDERWYEVGWDALSPGYKSWYYSNWAKDEDDGR